MLYTAVPPGDAMGMMTTDQAGHAAGRIYDGGAYLGNEKRSGRLRMNGGSAEFLGEGQTEPLRLPLHGIEIAAGGASNRLVYLSHPAVAGVTFFTSDRSILRDPLLVGSSSAAGQHAGAARRKRSAGWMVLAAGCGLMAALLMGLYLARPAIVGAVIGRVPASWEVKLGDAVFAALGKQMTLVENEELRQQLRKLADPLLAIMPDAPYEFKLHLAASEDVNAFAIPGGHMVVNSALILEADSPDEVAGVIAHEIAHVTLRHSLRNMISSIGTMLVVSVFFGDLDGIFAALVDNSSYLLRMSYSREFETEADRAAWQTMVRANLDPGGLESFLRRMQRLQADKGGAVMEKLAILGTHPAVGSRIDWLAAQPKPSTQHTTAGYDLNFREFKERLRKEVGTSKQQQKGE